MAKLKMLDFDNYKFEKELASESFCTKNDKVRVALKCAVTPVTNNVDYFVLVQGIFCKLDKFVFLEDAIIGYNDRLKEIEGEKDVG